MKRRNIKLLQWGWLLLGGIGYVISGCTAETVSPNRETEYGETVEVSCSLHIERPEGEPATRAGELNGEWTTEEESEIKDLTVIQFDGDGTDGSAKSVVIRKFQNPELGKLTIGLMQPKEAGKKQYVCFIANAGDAFDNFSGTLDELRNRQIILSETNIRSGKLLMTGYCSSVLAAEFPLSVSIYHRLVKIRFSYTLDLPQGDTFEPVWLQLLSISQVTQLETDANPLPAADAANFTAGIPVLENISGGYVWYIPENIRGTGNSSSGQASDKTTSNAPDAYCTCILLEGNYHNHSEGKDYKVYYRFYPGADNLNDYNLKGNSVYNVQLNIKGIETSDGRVTVEEWKGKLPGANCYMTAPGSTLTFDPYASPGTYISATGWGSYAARMGTKESSKIDRIGIVWQTEKGLIKNIHNLVSSGEIRLTTLDKPGNALVAAYDKENNILWSWHIWVTDYSLDNAPETMGDNTAQAVGNGTVYKFAGCIWMDRGIGATTADPSKITTLGYSYQWGRKDPFVAASELSGRNELVAPIAPMYDADGERIYISGKVFDQSYMNEKNYIFDQVMNNPTLFFTTGETGNKATKNLWYGMSKVTDLWLPNQKTFFDPCPAGWCIPSGNVTSSFTSGNVEVKNVGRLDAGVYAKNIDGLYWSLPGYRQIATGEAKGVGFQGIYWTSTFSDYGSEIRAVIYGGGTNGVDAIPRMHSDGQSARCVKQESL